MRRRRQNLKLRRRIEQEDRLPNTVAPNNSDGRVGMEVDVNAPDIDGDSGGDPDCPETQNNSLDAQTLNQAGNRYGKSIRWHPKVDGTSSTT